MTRSFIASLLLAASVAAACSEEAGVVAPPRSGNGSQTTTDPETGQVLPDYNDPRTLEKEPVADPLAGLPRNAQQNDLLCQRAGVMNDSNPNFNAVTNAFCKERRGIGNMNDLLAALGLDFKNPSASGTNGSNNNPAFALLGHSSSIVARNVSAINPRAFVFSPPPGQPVSLPGYVVVGFARGEPFVEIAAASPKAGNKLSLYLLKFDIACEPNCGNGDLLTPAIEKNWKGVSLYSDEDLKNTLMDCRHCHQPDGLSSPMMLRMQELEDPWTHWFRSDRPGGIALLQDYLRAHGDTEAYGGIPGVLIQKSDGRALEDLVKGQGFGAQPNVFDSRNIESEVQSSSNLQPQINKPKGRSGTWQNSFNRAFSGQFIPVPYHDVKVTDPDKLQYTTDEYKKFMTGATTVLPDIRRVFLDDALEDLTFVPKTGASGREVLVQTCAQCHQPKLDQSISRAKFDVTRLDSMSREEKNLAITRMNMSASNGLHMPPTSMRSLPDVARQAAIDFLSK